VNYIESNPVKAGLDERAELWAWSSAGQVGDLPHQPSKASELEVGQVPDLPE